MQNKKKWMVALLIIIFILAVVVTGYLLRDKIFKPVEPEITTTPSVVTIDPSDLPANQELLPQPLDLPLFIGVYPSGPLQNVVSDIVAMDEWLGTPTVTMAGTFLDLETHPESVARELNGAWDAGYIPFVNLGAGTAGIPHTAGEIASGVIDDAIREWARAYRDWTNQGEKRAFIAPLQEANGAWTSYGLDPDNYKLAYYRIQSIFAEEGVQRNWAAWVFAPNGWSEDGYEFELFYPGDPFVDAIGFSAFNFGSCPVWADENSWDGFNTLYRPYLDRMVEMAPNKPIIVAEVGSVEPSGDREKWLQEVITNFTKYPEARGWVYFNRAETAATLKCVPSTDYRVFKTELGTGSPIFKTLVTQPPYGHWANSDPEINGIMFNTIMGYFTDIDEVSLLSGKVSPWYTDYINRAFAAGIIPECSQTIIDLPAPVTDITLREYCPQDSLTRAQSTVFLLRSVHGASYIPPAASGTLFADVAASYWSASWIEQAFSEGLVTGCSDDPLNFCPEQEVTQADMAVFLLLARHDAGYTPPPASGIFKDVPTTHPFAAWIEQLALEGVSGGCGDGRFCPEEPVTKAQMAYLLVRAFGLP